MGDNELTGVYDDHDEDHDEDQQDIQVIGDPEIELNEYPPDEEFFADAAAAPEMLDVGDSDDEDDAMAVPATNADADPTVTPVATTGVEAVPPTPAPAMDAVFEDVANHEIPGVGAEAEAAAVHPDQPQGLLRRSNRVRSTTSRA